MPAPASVGPGVQGWFAHGNGTSVPYTVLTSDWANAVQGELLNVLTAAGISPDKANQSQLLTAIQTLGRIKLTSTLNLYISPSGSNTNSGLSSGAPFATLQKAWDVLSTLYDLGGQDVIINIADGTYTAGVTCSGHLVGQRDHLGFTTTPGVSGDIPAVSFLGNTANPQNVIINTSIGDCFAVGDFANISVSGVTMIASSTQPNAGFAIFAYQHARCYLGTGIRFGACNQGHVVTQRGATVFGQAGYTIFGSAPVHWYTTSQSEIAIAPTNTITLTGSPAFSTAFIVADTNSLCIIIGITFSGSASGVRYSIARNATVYTGTSGTTTYLLPTGGSAGATASGGIYD